jgi:tetratricopeptide (TPR) repeat protein
MNNLALVLRDQGQYAEAERLFRRVVAMDRRVLGERHPTVAIVLVNLANVLQRSGDYPGAVAIYRDAIEVKRATFPDDHWEIATVNSLIGGCLVFMREYRQAEPLLVASYPIVRAAFGEAHNRTRVALTRIVDLYDKWGRPEAARKYRALLPPVKP